ncbi:MAG: GNAT family N-acetyltransferase [Kordiimonadaceae bacterium]|nr:GNAT family N-acetyltransferase [Kordiimonadaceae bacterium]
MYILETERLIIRPFNSDDVAFLDYLHSDADVTRYIGGRTRSHDENVAFINTMQDLYTRNIGQLLVVRKSDNIPVGRTGFSCFYGVNDGDISWYYWGSPEKVKKDGDIFELAELGYSFAKAYWGKGYATEAAMAIKNQVYDKLGYQEFCSLIIKENIASINVAKKLGAREITPCMIDGKESLELRNVKYG